MQIAFANEVALISEAIGANAWRVRELVRKSPGRELLLPGAGVGGHCIPKDPWLLASSVNGKDVDVRLIPAARAINNDMPRHMRGLIASKTGDLKGKRILLLGAGGAGVWAWNEGYLNLDSVFANKPAAVASTETPAAEG